MIAIIAAPGLGSQLGHQSWSTGRFLRFLKIVSIFMRLHNIERICLPIFFFTLVSAETSLLNWLFCTSMKVCSWAFQYLLTRRINSWVKCLIFQFAQNVMADFVMICSEDLNSLTWVERLYDSCNIKFSLCFGHKLKHANTLSTGRWCLALIRRDWCHSPLYT